MGDSGDIKKKDQRDSNMKPDLSSTKSVDDVNKPESGGTSDPTINKTAPQVGDKLNISKPKKKVNTSTITPERKPKNTVMVVGGGNNTQMSSGGQRSSQDVLIIREKNNSLRDQFTAAMS